MSEAKVWMGYQIVQFDTLYSIPWKLLSAFCKKNGQRLRLNNPYLEDLSHQFGNYFSCVALPENREKVIEAFYSVKEAYENRRKDNAQLKMWSELTESEVHQLNEELNPLKKKDSK